MSPPLPKPEPYRAFGSPTGNVNKVHAHSTAKFLVDLTQDSDPVTRDSDSDEPVFLGSQASSRPVTDPHGGFNPLRAATRPPVIKPYERQLFPPGLGTASQPLPAQRRQQPPAPQPAPRAMSAQFSGSIFARPPSLSSMTSSMFPSQIRVPQYPGSQSRNAFPSRPPSSSVPTANLGGEYNLQGRSSSRSLLNARSPSTASTAKPSLDRPSTRDSHAPVQITPPSSSRFDTSGQESPSVNAMAGKAPKRTPQKVDWTVEKLVDELHERSVDVRVSHQDLVAFTLRSVQPREQRIMTGVDWFAGVSHDPVSAETDKTTDMLKIRIKHHVRGKKDQSTVYYEPLLLKTHKARVPKYRFHHKEIARNVLTPNTMLKFVPVIRDLRPGEDTQYNTWLKELERMDASCGFQPMGSREQRVIRTTRQERTAMIAHYLDYWLDRLGVSCNRSTLIRHMVEQSNDTDMTPHQKRMYETLQTEGSSPRSPVATRMARTFTEAFDSVFASDAMAKERQVTLRDVLQLDRSVEQIFESKKTVKTSQSQEEPAAQFEKFLDTYAIMGCLICFSNSCEHGDFGEKNEKRNFSLDCNGKIDKLFIKSPGAAEKGDNDGTRIEPCRRDCYMVRHDMVDRIAPNTVGANLTPWSTDDELLLKVMFAAVECSSRVRSKAQCMVAEILNRRCWEVQHHLTSLNMTIPEATPAKLPRAKNLPWYDRQKKMLMGDWQSETITHDHKLRVNLDPCHHDGPCTEANGCECVKNQVLCDKFCRCTDESCSYKFTGCACGSTGKTCIQRQREGRPCICVQLNRECDPSLCHGCGVIDRARPSNRADDSVMETGCQNCFLQHGKGKAVVPGQSQLEGCGYGLFAIEDIGQHEFVIEYTGELIMHDEGVRREARRGEAFDEDGVTSYVFSLLDSEGIWVDAAIYGNHSRYINHEAYDYNVEPKVLYVNGEYRIRFSATRNIEAGEELFFNYGGNFPNLTKKMIKDKTRGSHDVASEREASPVKKRGRPPGRPKASGNKAAKPQQAMRKEAPVPHAETLDDLDKLEAAPRGRKRRHAEIIEDEESDDYHPSMEESEPRESREDARARRLTRRRLENIEPEDVEPEAKEGSEDKEGSPVERGRRTRRTRRSEVEPASIISPRNRRGRRLTQQGNSRTRSESPDSSSGPVVDDEENTPRRGLRKRLAPSKIVADKDEIAVSVDDGNDVDEPRTPPRSTRYGRRRSRRVAESDDEGTADAIADSADESLSYSGMDFSRSGSRTHRERRKPRRYRDSDEP